MEGKRSHKTLRAVINRWYIDYGPFFLYFSTLSLQAHNCHSIAQKLMVDMELDLYLVSLMIHGIINVLQYINCSKKQN